MSDHPLIRKIYLYIFALLGLVLATVGAVRLVSLGLRIFVFPNADRNYAYPMAAPVAAPAKTDVVPAGPTQPSSAELQAMQDQQTASQHESDAAGSIALFVVGVPLYLYHWGVIKKEKTS